MECSVDLTISSVSPQWRFRIPAAACYLASLLPLDLHNKASVDARIIVMILDWDHNWDGHSKSPERRPAKLRMQSLELFLRPPR